MATYAQQSKEAIKELQVATSNMLDTMPSIRDFNKARAKVEAVKHKRGTDIDVAAQAATVTALAQDLYFAIDVLGVLMNKSTQMSEYLILEGKDNSLYDLGDK